MDLREAMVARHSVRSFDGRAIEGETEARLRAACEEASRESGLTFQLVTGEPGAFSGALAHYGKFSGVANYLAITGPKGVAAEEAAGYFGERVVLVAKTLGIDSCWVALTFSRRRARYERRPGERLIIVVALGYGTTEGSPHRSKAADEVAAVSGEVPAWFADGVAAALLAPTAVNQQNFRLTLTDEVRDGLPVVEATCGRGPCVHIDLGIVKYHVELAAGRDAFVWA